MTVATASSLAFRSISFTGLTALLGELDIPSLDLQLPLFNTHQLRPILQEKRLYPPRDFPHLIQERLPDIFVTHDWRESVLSVCETIRLALEYCLLSQTSRLSQEDFRQLAFEGVSFWLDWVFLDQSSRNVDLELDQILPVLFRESAVHVVASRTALSRAWCCYELAQMNRDAFGTTETNLTSLIPEDLEEYPSWHAVRSTDPEDKRRIEKRILELFPGGLPAMEALMVFAGLTADLGTQPYGITQRLAQASNRWVERFLGAAEA